MSGKVITYSGLKNLPVCPKCHRHGKASFYADGRSVFYHQVRRVSLGDMSMDEVKDHCLISSPFRAKERLARALAIYPIRREFGDRGGFQRLKQMARDDVYKFLRRHGHRWDVKSQKWLKVRKPGA